MVKRRPPRSTIRTPFGPARQFSTVDFHHEGNAQPPRVAACTMQSQCTRLT